MNRLNLPVKALCDKNVPHRNTGAPTKRKAEEILLELTFRNPVFVQDTDARSTHSRDSLLASA